MNVAIIGGSAPSTPALFDSRFALDARRFTFDLIGRSAPRLAAVKRAAEWIAAERGVPIDCRTCDAADARASFARADVIIVQFRSGGYAARMHDETFPHRYGLCGDEGLGPGGLAAAWRTWPELHEMLAAIARVNPRALVILLTSPIGILTRCARSAFPGLRLYGICELPWTTLREICRTAGVHARDASYAYIAVNHLGWFSDVRVGATAVVEPDEVRPLKYVRLAEAPAEVLAEQRRARPRGAELAKLADDAFARIDQGRPDAAIAAIRRRGTPWYEHAVAPLLCALAGDKTDIPAFLTAENAGYCARFAADDYLEMPFTVQAGRLVRQVVSTWRNDAVAARLQRLIGYERLAATAVLAQDRVAITAALGVHPWLDGVPVTDELVADVTGPPELALATSTR